MKYEIEEYSKKSSAQYTAGLPHSQSMRIAEKTLKEVLDVNFKDDECTVRILEIGGGPGDIMEKYSNKGYECTSLTNNPDEAKAISHKGKISIMQGDMHNLSSHFQENSFDVLLCSHVFEHSAAQYILATEMNYVLDEGGIVIIIVPDQDKKWIYEPYHYLVPTQDQLINMFEKSGFEVIKARVEGIGTTEHQIYIGRKLKTWTPE